MWRWTRPTVGSWVKLKASGRIGEIAKDDKDNLPHKIKCTNGEIAWNYYCEDEFEWVTGWPAMQVEALGLHPNSDEELAWRMQQNLKVNAEQSMHDWRLAQVIGHEASSEKVQKACQVLGHDLTGRLTEFAGSFWPPDRHASSEAACSSMDFILLAGMDDQDKSNSDLESASGQHA